MRKQQSDPEIGKRAYLEVYRLFGTQEEAGRKMGIDRSLISNWSKGNAPNAYNLQRMAKCGCDVVYVLTGHRAEYEKKCPNCGAKMDGGNEDGSA